MKNNASKSSLVKARCPYLRQLWSNKNTVVFDEATVGQRIEVWWICRYGHEFQESLKKVCSWKTFRCNECLYKNSVAYLRPELVPMWDVQKNGFSAENSLLEKSSSIWWKCENNHSSKRTVQSFDNDPSCYHCSAKPSKKVFDSYPELKNFWFSERNPNPDEVGSWSRELFWWRCENGHYFKRTISGQSKGKSSCILCVRKGAISDVVNKLLPFTVDVQKTRELLYEDFELNSFSSAFKKPVYWLCKNGHSFRRSFLDQLKNRRNCRECYDNVSSLELNVREAVRQSFPQLKVEYNYKDLNNVYEVDLFFPDLMKAIDVNGEYWHSNEVVKVNGWKNSEEKHSDKIQKCLKNDVQLVFVWENDWKNFSDTVVKNLTDFLFNDFVDKRLSRLNSEYVC